MDLNLEVVKEKPERLELFKFKVKESQDKFRVLTSETTKFTECFSGKIPFKKEIDIRHCFISIEQLC